MSRGRDRVLSALVLVAAQALTVGCLDPGGAYLGPMDTVAPTVVVSSPVAAGVASTDVPRNATFSVTFSETMSLKSLRGGIQLFKGRTPVDLAFSVPTPTATEGGVDRGDAPYEVGFNKAVGFLDGNSQYTLVFSTILTDTEGNPLSPEVRLSFGTGAL